MIKRIAITILTLQVVVCGATNPPESNEREELLPYADMNSWLTRSIDESAIIGGQTKTLYEIAPERAITGNVEYNNEGGSPWANSNVYARVAGVTKTNCSVFPVEGLDGKAAHLVTRIEKVKALGIVNISVIAAGSIYLGTMIEPIKSTSNPQGMLNSGIPFTNRPSALRFDYKIELSGEPDRLRITGFSPKKVIEGMDMPTAILLLQKRWEDSEGGLHASRIGTVVVNYTESCDWQIDATYPVIYGDATTSPEFIHEMGVGYEQRYGLNSRGENVPIKEESWSDENETPTHVILHFASSHGGAYIGSPGNQMWIDNVRFVY
ncbi:MAG: PCMD domain-containing protein [Rikenellaceae bacterium]